MFRLVYLAVLFLLVACGSDAPNQGNVGAGSEQTQKEARAAQAAQEALEAREARAKKQAESEKAAQQTAEKKRSAEAKVKAAVAALEALEMRFSTRLDFENQRSFDKGVSKRALLSYSPDPADPKKNLAALSEFIQARSELDAIVSSVDEEDKVYLELARDLHTQWKQKFTPSYFARRSESETALKEIHNFEKELDRVGIAFRTEKDGVSFSSVPKLAEGGTGIGDILVASQTYYEATGKFLKKYGDVLSTQTKVDLELRQALIFQYGAVKTKVILGNAREAMWKELEALGLKKTAREEVWDIKLFKATAKDPKEIVTKLVSLAESLKVGSTFFDRGLLAYDFNESAKQNAGWNGRTVPRFDFEGTQKKTFPQEHPGLVNGSYVESLRSEHRLVEELLSAFGATPTLESMQSELVGRALRSLQTEIGLFEGLMKAIGWQFTGQASETAIDDAFRKEYELRTRFEKPKSLIDYRNPFQLNFDLAHGVETYRVTQQILEHSNDSEAANQKAAIAKKLTLIEEIVRNELAGIETDRNRDLMKRYVDRIFPEPAAAP